MLETVGEGLWMAFQMAWEVGWALVLGFLLSGVVQGRQYVFCGAGCKAKFEADPARYLDPARRGEAAHARH